MKTTYISRLHILQIYSSLNSKAISNICGFGIDWNKAYLCLPYAQSIHLHHRCLFSLSITKDPLPAPPSLSHSKSLHLGARTRESQLCCPTSGFQSQFPGKRLWDWALWRTDCHRGKSSQVTTYQRFNHICL